MEKLGSKTAKEGPALTTVGTGGPEGYGKAPGCDQAGVTRERELPKYQSLS